MCETIINSLLNSFGGERFRVSYLYGFCGKSPDMKWPQERQVYFGLELSRIRCAEREGAGHIVSAVRN